MLYDNKRAPCHDSWASNALALITNGIMGSESRGHMGGLQRPI